jgi:hypothetical protein
VHTLFTGQRDRACTNMDKHWIEIERDKERESEKEGEREM